MKRLAAIVVLMLAPAVVKAAPACWPDTSMPVSLVAAGPTDKPKVGEVIYAASSVGLVWGYACVSDGGKTWTKVIAGGPWTSFPLDWLRILDVAMRGTDADRTALWNQYATAGAWDPRLQPDLDAIWAKLPNPPPVTAWKVLADPFRADKKRVVYTVVNGKRSTATTQYVDAGAPCDPVTTITEYGPTYYLSVLGNPALVARCVKQ